MKELQTQQAQRPEDSELLEEYSTKELEEWVLRRFQARALWSSLAPPVAHQRPLRDFGSRVFRRSSVFPDGGWLLVLMSEVLYSVDLDGNLFFLGGARSDCG